jgi:hypothetical protein
MNQQHHLSPHRRTPRWISIAWLVVLGAMLSWKAVPVTYASHTDSGSWRLHQWNMHWASGDASVHGEDDEDYCAESYIDGTISDSTLATRVRETLVVASPHWDGTAGTRVDLWKTDSRCDAYADDAWIELEFHAYSDVTHKCGSNYTCVTHHGPTWSAAYGHYHYMWENNHIKYASINGDYTVYRRLLNHEAGHMYGLLDGSGSGTDCSPQSIMHNVFYNCPYSGWYPTSSDFNKVVSIANGG